MGNDLKYGLVLGVVVLLLFVGYMAIKTRGHSNEAETVIPPSTASSQTSGTSDSSSTSPTGSDFDIMAPPTPTSSAGISATSPAGPVQPSGTGVSPAPIVSYEIGRAPAPIGAVTPTPVAPPVVKSSPAAPGQKARPAGQVPGTGFTPGESARRPGVVVPAVGAVPPVSSGDMVSQDLAQPPAPRPEIAATNEKTYTIAAGDRLADIAKKYYGDENKWHKIADANKGLDPNRLKVGQKIVIPDAAGETAPTPGISAGGAAEHAAAGTAASGKTYVVQAHDTLSKIALKFYKDRSQWHKILDANKDKLTSADQLKVGMKLTIP